MDKYTKHILKPTFNAIAMAELTIMHSPKIHHRLWREKIAEAHSRIAAFVAQREAATNGR